MKSIFFISLLLHVTSIYGQTNFVSSHENIYIQPKSYITFLWNSVWKMNSQVSEKEFKYDGLRCSGYETGNITSIAFALSFKDMISSIYPASFAATSNTICFESSLTIPVEDGSLDFGDTLIWYTRGCEHV